MTLMEEKTLADHDINVRSIRQELQLLEEQLKKHGRNEPSQSPTVQPDTDTISRQDALDAIFSEPLYESGMKKRDADAVVPAIYEKIKALPPSPSRPHDISKAKFSCPICGAEMEVTVDEWDEGG